MKIGVLITTNDIEKSWNAFRYMNAALEMGHEVTALLMNSGVECEFIEHEFFNISEQMHNFVQNKGQLFSCGTCLQFRKLRDKVRLSEITTIIKAVKMTEENDKMITF